jgi:hypothetical protein
MLVALILSLALSGQDAAPSRDCLDDNGTDRCAREGRAEVLATLGMVSIEDEQAAGAEVYRTLQVDGYGNVMPSIAYERRVGEPPQVVVYAADGNRLTAPVPADEWATVQAMARFADRTLEPLPGPADPLASLCLHAWLSTVEIANAAERGVPAGPVRRRTESACNGTLTTRFAFDLPALAIKHFPECERLDPEDHRNDMTRLAQCIRFKGDRLAVAELMNQVGWRLTPDRDADTPRAWAVLFGLNAETRLDWAGERVTAGRGLTGNAVAAYLAQRQTEDDSLRAYISGYNGTSSTRVETTGRIDRDGPDNTRLSAPFSQVWLWNSNGLNWTLDSWTIQAFTPIN